MIHIEKSIEIRTPRGPALQGTLSLPDKARGIVLFAHGSGSSRLSPRNRFVARALNRAGLGTLLFDLLTPAEDTGTAAARFDIDLLASRLVVATDWVTTAPETRGLRVGYFGASTGAAAALVAAAQRPLVVAAVVSRGGRPDLAGPALASVEAPTRLLVGGEDREVLKLNEAALKQLRHGDLVVIPSATHLFEESGALQKVANSAAAWFSRYLLALSAEPPPPGKSDRLAPAVRRAQETGRVPHDHAVS